MATNIFQMFHKLLEICCLYVFVVCTSSGFAISTISNTTCAELQIVISLYPSSYNEFKVFRNPCGPPQLCLPQMRNPVSTAALCAMTSQLFSARFSAFLRFSQLAARAIIAGQSQNSSSALAMQ